MSKRMWLAAAVAGTLIAIPAALMLVNLQIMHRSWLADDLTTGMIFLGVGMIGVGGLIAAPVPLRAIVTIAKG
jgi:hypothetical protein